MTVITAPTSFESLQQFPSSTVEFPRSIREPKGEREVKTEWVISEVPNTKGGTEQVVLRLATRHVADWKQYRSTLSYFVRNTDPGSPFVTEFFSPFQQKQAVLRAEPTARYSKVALATLHAAVLAGLEDDFTHAAPVVEEAFTKVGEQ